MANKGTRRVKIRKGDQVVVTAGKDYNIFDRNGKRTPHRGRVLDVDPVKGKVKVEGAGIVKRHQRPNPGANRPGGIIEQARWIDISNVQLIDPADGKPTRVRYDVAEDGKSKTRVASGSGQALDKE
jgi:large subunit ribosomal protein L24